MLKEDVVSYGLRLGAPMDKSWTCYLDGPLQCGEHPYAKDLPYPTVEAVAVMLARAAQGLPAACSRPPAPPWPG
ncbi:hypothetical protein [Nonomuraea sp. NPDC005650]|uniref:hypothetical protein n=1 Tax=Nonomuraea sp. NPDC005650 TaxID=3157045 RepID=UPI0033A03682